MRVVFLGTSPFAVPCLRALANDSRFTIDLVITQPDRPVGRKQLLTPPPVKIAAQELKFPIAQPENISTRYSLPATYRPNFLVVVSYGQILPQVILDWPSIAAMNIHASLLPKYRGASPIQHSILNGDATTGVTVQRMIKELDAGPILSQESITIDPRETFQSLHDKLAQTGAELLIETLLKPLKESPQNDSDATFCKKLIRTDGIADPRTMDAVTIDRMARALTPWPGVSIDGNKILETALIADEDALTVSCAENSTLYVTKIQPPSGKTMTGRAFAQGHKVMP
jgi:methionyl-tRNA formyltransferase